MRYVKLRRLNAARSRLLESHDPTQTVTQVAFETGIVHQFQGRKLSLIRRLCQTEVVVSIRSSSWADYADDVYQCAL